jgi:hypothetical protein
MKQQRLFDLLHKALYCDDICFVLQKGDTVFLANEVQLIPCKGKSTARGWILLGKIDDSTPDSGGTLHVADVCTEQVSRRER